MTPLKPGSVIGILGGGQLGRMLSSAAAKLGFDVHIFTDEEDSPAERVSAHTTVASYDNRAALEAFAGAVHVVTTEFENIPVSTLEALEALGVAVRPSSKAVATAQDRLSEKTFFNGRGIATAPFLPIYTREDLHAGLAKLGAPAILKTRRLGYDGKGQWRLTGGDEADAAFDALNGAGAILEGLVAFEREASIILARGVGGEIAAYDLCENHHEGGILRVTRCPSSAGGTIAADAFAAAKAVADALDYVGVLAVEFFIAADGRVIANEMAPRVHNSGHWTHEGCETSQFEQQIRAVAGWPLGPTTRHFDVEMQNLIGPDSDDWERFSGENDARLTLYGKREARPGRKMGHITRLRPRAAATQG